MPTNPYFNSQVHTRATQERLIVEDLIVESIKIYGIDCYVIPRDDVALDLVYGEDPLKAFSKSYAVEMFMNTPLGYGGAGNFFSKFGLEIRDDTTFVVARRAFITRVPSPYRRTTGGPREGDLIWCPLTNTLFEIKMIEEEKGFFQLGNQLPYYYEITCERFRYASERFATGLDDLNQAMQQHGYLIVLNLASSGNGKYFAGETIYQANTPGYNANATLAVVQAYNHSNHTLNVAHIKGVFAPNVTVWGVNSNASYALTSYNDMADIRINDIVDNTRLEIAGNNIIDFSVSNPFGAP
jgi:hypothetical protein